VGADYATQLEQIFRNIELGLKTAGASLENLIKLNFFVSGAVPMADVLASHFDVRDKYINLEKMSHRGRINAAPSRTLDSDDTDGARLALP
jgi:enamine deaminase RidA (YjgF/YER057c/UK114 family)